MIFRDSFNVHVQIVHINHIIRSENWYDSYAYMVISSIVCSIIGEYHDTIFEKFIESLPKLK